MTKFCCKLRFGLLAMLWLAGSLSAWAGPPFLTDDPQPVDYQNWEVYFASQHFETYGDWTGTAPHVEINYGVITNVQLHVIAPLAYNAPAAGAAHYGPGDIELGVKFRFIEETTNRPQAGIFPLLEVPAGSESEGLDTGHLQAYLPVWLQKSYGNWTAYGGGGYEINPGVGNKNWGFTGAVVQNQIRTNILLGGEIYYHTKLVTGGRSDTVFNLGTVVDFNEHQHLMFSAGRSIAGPTAFQAYIAFQFTFGPEFFQSLGHWFGRK